MKFDILGVKIDKIGWPEVQDKINQWLSGSGQHYMVTVNPEFIVASQTKADFKDCLNQADLAICDGVGLVWAGLFLYGKKLIRLTGVDVVENIFNLSGQDKNVKIFLLGGKEGIGQKVQAKFTHAGIVGVESGGVLTVTGQMANNPAVIEHINQSGSNVLLVAFGQVKQELWIKNNLSKIPNIKLAIGVGGTFDYLSGEVKRAPAWVRKMGLEWLYRLFRQPQRIGRIYNAWIKFSWLVFWRKVRGR